MLCANQKCGNESVSCEGCPKEFCPGCDECLTLESFAYGRPEAFHWCAACAPPVRARVERAEADRREFVAAVAAGVSL